MDNLQDNNYQAEIASMLGADSDIDYEKAIISAEVVPEQEQVSAPTLAPTPEEPAPALVPVSKEPAPAPKDPAPTPKEPAPALVPVSKEPAPVPKDPAPVKSGFDKVSLLNAQYDPSSFTPRGADEVFTDFEAEAPYRDSEVFYAYNSGDRARIRSDAAKAVDLGDMKGAEAMVKSIAHNVAFNEVSRQVDVAMSAGATYESEAEKSSRRAELLKKLMNGPEYAKVFNNAYVRETENIHSGETRKLGAVETTALDLFQGVARDASGLLQLGAAIVDFGLDNNTNISADLAKKVRASALINPEKNLDQPVAVRAAVMAAESLVFTGALNAGLGMFARTAPYAAAPSFLGKAAVGVSGALEGVIDPYAQRQIGPLDPSNWMSLAKHSSYMMLTMYSSVKAERYTEQVGRRVGQALMTSKTGHLAASAYSAIGDLNNRLLMARYFWGDPFEDQSIGYLSRLVGKPQATSELKDQAARISALAQGRHISSGKNAIGFQVNRPVSSKGAREELAEIVYGKNNINLNDDIESSYNVIYENITNSDTLKGFGVLPGQRFDKEVSSQVAKRAQQARAAGDLEHATLLDGVLELGYIPSSDAEIQKLARQTTGYTTELYEQIIDEALPGYIANTYGYDMSTNTGFAASVDLQYKKTHKQITDYLASESPEFEGVFTAPVDMDPRLKSIADNWDPDIDGPLDATVVNPQIMGFAEDFTRRRLQKGNYDDLRLPVRLGQVELDTPKTTSFAEKLDELSDAELDNKLEALTDSLDDPDNVLALEDSLGIDELEVDDLMSAYIDDPVLRKQVDDTLFPSDQDYDLKVIEPRHVVIKRAVGIQRTSLRLPAKKPKYWHPLSVRSLSGVENTVDSLLSAASKTSILDGPIDFSNPNKVAKLGQLIGATSDDSNELISISRYDQGIAAGNTLNSITPTEKAALSNSLPDTANSKPLGLDMSRLDSPESVRRLSLSEVQDEILSLDGVSPEMRESIQYAKENPSSNPSLTEGEMRKYLSDRHLKKTPLTQRKTLRETFKNNTNWTNEEITNWPEKLNISDKAKQAIRDKTQLLRQEADRQPNLVTPQAKTKWVAQQLHEFVSTSANSSDLGIIRPFIAKLAKASGSDLSASELKGLADAMANPNSSGYKLAAGKIQRLRDRVPADMKEELDALYERAATARTAMDSTAILDNSTPDNYGPARVENLDTYEPMNPHGETTLSSSQVQEAVQKVALDSKDPKSATRAYISMGKAGKWADIPFEEREAIEAYLQYEKKVVKAVRDATGQKVESLDQVANSSQVKAWLKAHDWLQSDLDNLKGTPLEDSAKLVTLQLSDKLGQCNDVARAYMHMSATNQIAYTRAYTDQMLGLRTRDAIGSGRYEEAVEIAKGIYTDAMNLGELNINPALIEGITYNPTTGRVEVPQALKVIADLDIRNPIVASGLTNEGSSIGHRTYVDVTRRMDQILESAGVIPDDAAAMFGKLPPNMDVLQTSISGASDIIDDVRFNAQYSGAVEGTGNIRRLRKALDNAEVYSGITPGEAKELYERIYASETKTIGLINRLNSLGVAQGKSKPASAGGFQHAVDYMMVRKAVLNHRALQETARTGKISGSTLKALTQYDIRLGPRAALVRSTVNITDRMFGDELRRFKEMKGGVQGERHAFSVEQTKLEYLASATNGPFKHRFQRMLDAYTDWVFDETTRNIARNSKVDRARDSFNRASELDQVDDARFAMAEHTKAINNDGEPVEVASKAPAVDKTAIGNIDASMTLDDATFDQVLKAHGVDGADAEFARSHRAELRKKSTDPAAQVDEMEHQTGTPEDLEAWATNMLELDSALKRNK